MDWLRDSDLPKLFINAEPGMLITGDARAICLLWRNQQEVTSKVFTPQEAQLTRSVARLPASWRQGGCHGHCDYR
jgi:hypothetical protein